LSNGIAVEEFATLQDFQAGNATASTIPDATTDFTE
jgi:hypothetical protein